MDTVEIFEDFTISVSEMTGDPGGMVALDPVFAKSVTEGDDDPKFATYVIESGWSKSKRFWGPELFGKVASEINSAATTEPIVGYMGHIRPEDDPYLFPEIQLQWVGAKLLSTGEKAKLAVKAYVLPGSKAREYAKRGFVKTVSWRGKIASEPYERGIRVKEFLIESIDLSRPRAAGMSARMVGALSSEMEQGGSEVKPEEIAALSANELRAHAPALVKSIEDDAKKPLEVKVSEMETAADTTKPALDLIPQLRTLLGMDDKAEDVSVISAAVAELRKAGKTLRDSVLATVLGKKLKGDDERNRKLVTRLIAGEMASKEIKLTGDSDKDEEIVGKIVGEIIDSSADLKSLVSEMEGAPPNVTGTTPPGTGSSTKYEPGTVTSNVRVKARA
jgi:hypothetical protein